MCSVKVDKLVEHAILARGSVRGTMKTTKRSVSYKRSWERHYAIRSLLSNLIFDMLRQVVYLKRAKLC
jgi:hypothetical protein